MSSPSPSRSRIIDPTLPSNQEQKKHFKPSNGTFLTLRVVICRTDNLIATQRPTESESFASLNGPLSNPHCRICKPDILRRPWIVKQVVSHFREHSKLCLDLDHGMNDDVKVYLSRELDNVEKELVENLELLRKAWKDIEGKHNSLH
jgi:hypothetical protein